MSSSDEDEKKKRSINEMFGDDDSDDDSDDQVRPVSTSTTADASGLFGSDSESEEEEERKPRKKISSAKPPAKKAKSSSSSSATSSKKRRGSTDKGKASSSSSSSSSARKVEERSRPQGDSGDEYDSGDDVVRTKDDDDFIDHDDDLADVMGEYDQEDQRFDDERPLPELGGKAQKEEDYFTQTLQSLKTGRGRRKMNLSVQEQEQIVQEVLYRMDKAHADDLASIAKRQPALERLKYVDEAIRILRKQQLQPTFLDFDLLSFIKKWIQPLDDGSLPNLGIRTKLLQLVTHLPVMKEHLKRSGFGKIVMVLWKHPQETRDNKEVCRDLIERWSRAVFDKTLDYSKLAELEAEKAENLGFRRPTPRPQQKSMNLSRGYDSANPFLGRSSEPREGQIVTQRAIMPKQLRVDYLHRPQPKVELQQAAKEKVETGETRKTRLLKRMQDIARPGRKGKGAVSMSIEGR